MQVSGYVKAVSSAGVFVALARNAEARVKMGHLSDSFVKDPKAAFPEGKLVHGRVISSADGRQCSEPFQGVFLRSHPEAGKHALGFLSQELRSGQLPGGLISTWQAHHP